MSEENEIGLLWDKMLVCDGFSLMMEISVKADNLSAAS